MHLTAKQIVIGVSLLAAPSCLAAGVELIPTAQSRFIDLRVDAENVALDQSDSDHSYDEAADFGPFNAYLLADATVSSAAADGSARLISEILSDRISTIGFIFARAQTSAPSTVASGLSTSWSEVSFTLSGACEAELDILLSNYDNTSSSMQLWKDTPDGPIAIWSDHIPPNSALETTRTGSLEAGDYRLRVEMSGGAWAEGLIAPFEDAFGQFSVTFTVSAPPCAADLDGDGDTDQADLGVLLASYGVDDGGDVDGDGDTDQADLGALLSSFGCA